MERGPGRQLLYAFDALSGNVRWGPVKLRSGYSSYSTVTYDKGWRRRCIFAFSNDSPPGAYGVISAFDALPGAQLWQTLETVYNRRIEAEVPLR